MLLQLLPQQVESLLYLTASVPAAKLKIPAFLRAAYKLMPKSSCIPLAIVQPTMAEISSSNQAEYSVWTDRKDVQLTVELHVQVNSTTMQAAYHMLRVEVETE